ncbi:MAG: MazG nucleotide pyrophosphohydrolase domain-containing protein, partial [Gemmatimonadaceae bacterium]
LAPRDRLLDAAAALAEEAAEVLSQVRKHLFFARELDRAALREELGDVLWCTAALATQLDMALGDIAAHNLAKLEARYPR